MTRAGLLLTRAGLLLNRGRIQSFLTYVQDWLQLIQRQDTILPQICAGLVTAHTEAGYNILPHICAGLVTEAGYSYDSHMNRMNVYECMMYV